MPGQLEPKAESGIVQGLMGRCPGSLEGGKAPAASGWAGGFSGSTSVLGREGGSEVCRQAAPLGEVGVHTGEKEEAAGGGGARKGKRPEGSCSCWGGGVPCQLGLTCTPRGCLPAPGLELPKQSLSCPGNHWAQDPKEVGTSEDSRPLL